MQPEVPWIRCKLTSLSSTDLNDSHVFALCIVFPSSSGVVAEWWMYAMKSKRPHCAAALMSG